MTTRDLSLAYRRVFASDEGKMVLTDLLNELGFYTVSKTDEERIRRNVATELLAKLGIIHGTNVFEIVKALYAVQIPDEPAPTQEDIEYAR